MFVQLELHVRCRANTKRLLNRPKERSQIVTSTRAFVDAYTIDSTERGALSYNLTSTHREFLSFTLPDTTRVQSPADDVEAVLAQKMVTYLSLWEKYGWVAGLVVIAAVLAIGLILLL